VDDDLNDLAVQVLGTVVRLRAPAGVLDELRAALIDLPRARAPHRLVELAEADDGLVLLDRGRVVRRGIEPGLGAATAVWHLNAIATEATGHVVLHAACVADEPGGAVLLPGRSGAGKSTLAAACVTAGLGYLSDELAAVNVHHGTVTPYPKPLSLDEERLVAASTLGMSVSTPTAPVAIVFPRYEPGADLHEVPLDLGWTLLALAAHTPNLAALGGRGLAWLAGLAVACPATQLTYGEASLAVPAVRRAARSPAVRVIPAPTLAPVTPGTTAVALGEELAVLHHPTGQVNLLNRTAAAVWRGAAATVDRVTAVDAILSSEETAGLDPATVAATIDHLVSTGLLAADDPS
jgi:hypothetical protein